MTDSEPNPEPEEVFDFGRIRQLMELMEQHGLSEIDLRRDKQRIRLRRGGQLADAPAEVIRAPEMPVPAATSTPAPRTEDDPNLVLIRSPMVGTYYSRPNPESESFVKVGDRVSADQTICIIEAMKVFNEIPAEVSGRIVAILVDDEEPVEYGKPLFKVDTSK